MINLQYAIALLKGVCDVFCAIFCWFEFGTRWTFRNRSNSNQIGQIGQINTSSVATSLRCTGGAEPFAFEGSHHVKSRGNWHLLQVELRPRTTTTSATGTPKAQITNEPFLQLNSVSLPSSSIFLPLRNNLLTGEIEYGMNNTCTGATEMLWASTKNSSSIH